MHLFQLPKNFALPPNFRTTSLKYASNNPVFVLDDSQKHMAADLSVKAVEAALEAIRTVVHSTDDPKVRVVTAMLAPAMLEAVLPSVAKGLNVAISALYTFDKEAGRG